MTVAEKKFVRTVRRYYNTHGRHELPWRRTQDPYRILVSEIMLQQTQVDRVLPKYEAFLKKFPTVQTLAVAPLRDVLALWQGLGYNRRAKSLWLAAQRVVNTHAGVFPCTYKELLALPGVGHYTAGAILAFAFNKGIPVLETNIRTVVIYHFYPEQAQVTEAAIMKVVEATLDMKRPREWYYALMDYGVHIKATQSNYHRQSAVYKKQSKFAGSTRQVRAAIVRELLTSSKGRSKAELLSLLPKTTLGVIETQLQSLLTEKMIEKTGQRYRIAI